MRHIILLALALAPAFAASLQIDHVTVAGRDLAALRQAFSDAMGVPTEYGGAHSNHATEMALTSFPDGSYLELMGIPAQADEAALNAQPWNKFLRNNGGPCAWAVRASDVAAEVARLKALGLRVGAPEPSGRTRPDGIALQWETADVGPVPRGSLFPFLIRDLTPRNNRAYIAGQPTTDRFRGVAKVVIGVRNLDAAIPQYRRAFDLPEPRRQNDPDFEADLAWFEGTPVVLAQGTGESSWLARRVAEFGEAPCAFVLALNTGNGVAGGKSSYWFGGFVSWSDTVSLGWRLGVQAVR